MAHSVLIDGTAYGIKGGKCLVDGTEYSIKRGIGLVEGTQVEYKFTVEPSLVINSKNDWDYFAQNASTFSRNELVRLNSNIDLLFEQYEPIEFYGNFDGAGYVIENATIQKYGNDRGGIFREICSNQIIANLNLRNIQINSEDYNLVCGLISGYSKGSNGEKAIIQNIRIEDCIVIGSIVGGVIGKSEETIIRYCCIDNSTIQGENIAGGIVGENGGKVEFCYSKNIQVVATTIGGYKGGVIGQLYSGESDYCWAYTTVVGALFENSTENNSLVADEYMDVFDFMDEGFDQSCWIESDDGGIEFNENEVRYEF